MPLSSDSAGDCKSSSRKHKEDRMPLSSDSASDCKSSSRKHKEDRMPLSSDSAGDCKSSSRKLKEDPTYSYLVKIIPPNNKKRATVHEMYDVERCS